jgi:hypothetical protein
MKSRKESFSSNVGQFKFFFPATKERKENPIDSLMIDFD